MILYRTSNAWSGYPNVPFDKNAPRKGAPDSSVFVTAWARLIRRPMVASLLDHVITHHASAKPTVITMVIASNLVTLDQQAVDAVTICSPALGYFCPGCVDSAELTPFRDACYCTPNSWYRSLRRGGLQLSPSVLFSYLRIVNRDTKHMFEGGPRRYCMMSLPLMASSWWISR